MDLYYIGMILYIYGMKPYHICMKSCLTNFPIVFEVLDSYVIVFCHKDTAGT